MKWTLKDEHGNELLGVFSLRIEHAKGKPSTLSYVMKGDQSFPTQYISVWRGDERLFKGQTYPHPTKIINSDYTWVAVAIDDTFQAEKERVLSSLNNDVLLIGNIKECEGAKAGFVHIHPVTHAVSWVSLETPEVIWNSQGLHERDSVQIIPIHQELKGLKATVTFKEKRLESGMMDVGPFISGVFPHGIETYSGAALEEQWGHLAFRALRAGYDIHQAELLPTSYRRVDLPKRLNFLTQKDELVSIPYQAYAVKLLLGWAVPVTTHTTVSIETETADEALSFSLIDESQVNEGKIIDEMIQWMKAYAIVRSFTAQVKYRILITDDMSIATLGVGAWSVLHDPRLNSVPIKGPIVGCVVSNEGGTTWADITLLWAPARSLQVTETARLMATEGNPVSICKTPNNIIESVRLMKGATEQHDYYLRQKSNTFETMAKGFPMTHIEIGLHPVAQTPTEYLERRYRLAEYSSN